MKINPQFSARLFTLNTKSLTKNIIFWVNIESLAVKKRQKKVMIMERKVIVKNERKVNSFMTELTFIKKPVQ